MWTISASRRYGSEPGILEGAAATAALAAAPGTFNDLITHGIQLTPELIGPSGTLDTADFSGNIYLRQSWLDANNGGSPIIENVTISGCGWSCGAGVSDIPEDEDGFITLTFRNVEFTGVGQANGGRFLNTALSGDDIPSNFRIIVEDFRVDGMDEVTDELEEHFFVGPNVHLYRGEIKNLCGSTRNADSNWSMEEMLVWKMASLSPEATPHSSAVGILQGTGITLTRCRFLTYDENGVEGDNIGATAAIDILARQQGNSSGITITNCSAGGGGYAVEAGATGSFTLTDFTVDNLIIERGAYQSGGRFGPVTSFDNDDTDNPNTWDATWGPLGSHNTGGDPAEGVAVPAA